MGLFFACLFGLLVAFFSNATTQISIHDQDKMFSLAKDFLPANPIILNAGAFDGTDTIIMSKIWPNGKIYAFEPVPEIYKRLCENTKKCANVYRFPLALSDSNGFRNFFLSELESHPGVSFQSGSLLAPKEHLVYAPFVKFNDSLTVPTINLDYWASLYNISKIDFMWLDMQGMELTVLKSAPKILEEVKVIWTEVEFVEAYEGQATYEEMRQYLLSRGFVEYAKNFEAPMSGGWGWFGDVMFVNGTLLKQAKS